MIWNMDFQSWPQRFFSLELHCHLVGQIHEDKKAHLNVYIVESSTPVYCAKYAKPSIRYNIAKYLSKSWSLKTSNVRFSLLIYYVLLIYFVWFMLFAWHVCVFSDGTLCLSSSTQITKLKIGQQPFAKGFRDKWAEQEKVRDASLEISN